jgi:hypothetical protein
VQGPEDRQLLVGEASRFSVVFQIEPSPTSALSEDEVLDKLKQRDGELRTKLDEIARKPPSPEGTSTDPDLSFNVVVIEYRQGSIEILVILGVVYAGIKDYETVRNSLQALIRDMRDVIVRVLSDSDAGQVGSVAPGRLQQATSVTVRERGVPGQRAPQVINAATSADDLPANVSSVVQLRRWIATYLAVLLAVLYLVVTNIVLIVILGRLVLQTA